MDDGFVIPGLNEGYTLAGAKIMEWVSGLMFALIAQEVMKINIATSGPLMIALALGGTFGLAGLRRSFPDEERGIRNAAMVWLGWPPPGIPCPATLREYWSGAPIRALDEKSYFSQLQLGAVLGDGDEEGPGSIFLGK